MMRTTLKPLHKEFRHNFPISDHVPSLLSPFALKFATLRQRSPVSSSWTYRTAAHVRVCVYDVCGYFASQCLTGLPDCRCTKDEFEPMIIICLTDHF